jgi:hypothetical protein
MASEMLNCVRPVMLFLPTGIRFKERPRRYCNHHGLPTILPQYRSNYCRFVVDRLARIRRNGLVLSSAQGKL